MSYDDPGDDERQGFDWLGKFCVFVLWPTMALGLFLTAWWVAENVP